MSSDHHVCVLSTPHTKHFLICSSLSLIHEELIHVLTLNHLVYSERSIATRSQQLHGFAQFSILTFKAYFLECDICHRFVMFDQYIEEFIFLGLIEDDDSFVAASRGQ